MRMRTIDAQQDPIQKRSLEPNQKTMVSARESAVDAAALSGPQGKMLAMQSQRGNQYVLRMMSQGAFRGGTVQRDESDSDQEAPDASNSMVGDAANFVGDLLGVKGIPGKVKQGVGKVQEGVNAGIDWTIDKVRGGAQKVEEWMED